MPRPRRETGAGAPAGETVEDLDYLAGLCTRWFANRGFDLLAERVRVEADRLAHDGVVPAGEKADRLADTVAGLPLIGGRAADGGLSWAHQCLHNHRVVRGSPSVRDRMRAVDPDEIMRNDRARRAEP